MTTNDYIRKTLVPLFCAGALLRIVSFFVSENAGGDALARVALTAQWLRNPTFDLHFSVWLPMHFWMIAATSFFVRDVQFAGRLLSLILGIASLYTFWRLAKELDGPESATYSSILFVFYSLHIGYSATSSCDVPYLFFLLAGLVLFFRWRNQGGFLSLSSAGFLLALGSGIRYETWIVIFSLDLILLYRRQWVAFGLFGLLSGLWPVFWMSYEWFTRGDPLYAPIINHASVAQDLGFAGTSLLYRLLLPPGVILITLTPMVLIGVLFSAQHIRKKKGLLDEFGFVVCFFSLAQFYQILSGGVMSFARYTLTLGTMAAILAGVGLRQVLPHKKVIAGVMMVNLATLVMLTFVQNPLTNKVRSISPVLRFVPYLHDTGEFLNRHLGQRDAVVFDNYNYEANQLVALSGMPLLENERAFRIPDPSDRPGQATKFAQLLPYLHNRHPKYLVYADRGELRNFLAFSDCHDKWVDQLYFHCVFHNAYYQIYEVRY